MGYPKPLWFNAGLTAAAIILLLLAAAALIVLLGRFVTPTEEEQQIAQEYRPPGADEVPANPG